MKRCEVVGREGVNAKGQEMEKDRAEERVE